MNQAHELFQAGQSLWYDNIQRGLLENGELQQMIDDGLIRGVTSNPTIFQNAIAKSNDYNDALQTLAWAGWNAEDIFWRLAVEDIQAAADLFLPLYNASQGADGYVSLEVNPYLAHDGQKTFEEAQRLWKRVNRPNLMIKIPATVEGLPAVRMAIAEGINVNVTLIFSVDRYRDVMDAYLGGLEDRAAMGKPVHSIASVASFFVSRLDTSIDNLLQNLQKKGELEAATVERLQGRAAVANARLAYMDFRRVFDSERFKKLEARGARLQRALWASTGTKNPEYSDVLYVDELIGADTVNTVPPKTLMAFLDHGRVADTLSGRLEESRQLMDELEAAGISLSQVTDDLEAAGVKAFADSFTSLLETVEERRKQAAGSLGVLAPAVSRRLESFSRERIPERIAAHEVGLWSEDPVEQTEISQRLDWLEAPSKNRLLAENAAAFLQECRQDGLTHALLLGMGGSSLAPEVLRGIFGLRSDSGNAGLDLAILDSTDPEQVQAMAERSGVEKTLYIVASKSGTTAEINALLDFFWEEARKQLGEKAGKQFVAITDPGTQLETQAHTKGFRRVFYGDPNVGGRYSALTAFGLVPAGLLGLRVEEMLDRAARFSEQCGAQVPAARNPGLALGAVLAEAWLAGKDKLTILADAAWGGFGAWLEQLVAESSGKNNRGLIPVCGEALNVQLGASGDRIIVYLRESGDDDRLAEELRKHGQTVLTFNLRTPYAVGAEFYRWEYAVLTACLAAGVDPVNQPDVQDSKTRTKTMIARFKETGGFKMPAVKAQVQGATLYGENLPGLGSISSLKEAVRIALKSAGSMDYIAINAYLPRLDAADAALEDLRRWILAEGKRPVTIGYGPRFLHSTGQLHKGGANNGVFIQITRTVDHDLEIPAEGLTFGQLQRAQALGDFDALVSRKRRVLYIDLAGNDLAALKLG